jgi:hypothetical protein
MVGLQLLEVGVRFLVVNGVEREGGQGKSVKVVVVEVALKLERVGSLEWVELVVAGLVV